MSFTSLLKQDGVGVIWAIEVSNDNFATIAHRWATQACHIGAIRFDPRIVKIGKLTKGFGLDSLPTVSTVSLVLDNTAFDMDWLVDVSGGPIEFTYRFRLTLGLYDPKALSGVVDVEPTTQVMGTFGMLDSPARTSSTVELQLADDSMGRFNDLASSPTINEWIADGGSTGDNNVLTAAAIPAISFDSPLPLVFGPTAKCFFASIVGSGQAGALYDDGYTHAVIACVTTDSDTVASHDVERFDATFRADAFLGKQQWVSAGTTISMPKTVTVLTGDPFYDPSLTTPGTYNIWAAQKTQGISKDGKTWKVLWVAFNPAGYHIWATKNLGTFIGGTQPDGSVTARVDIAPTLGPFAGLNGQQTQELGAIDHFTITGFPFSARTEKTSLYQTGLSVIQDLISYYSAGSSSDLDTAAFTTAKLQNTCWVAGTLQPLQPPTGGRPTFVTPIAAAITPGQLRQALQDLARSISVDLYFTWAGLLSVSAGWFDFASITATRLAIDETRCQHVRERKPSQGERWSFYNRLFIQGPDGLTRGPFDNQESIDATGVRIPRTLEGKWLLPDTGGGDPTAEYGLWQILPRIDAKQRNLITFTTDREALQLDLGSMFGFTWTRGNTGAVYSGAAFHVESIAVDPMSLSVDIEGVWVDDIATINPYLLDDESLVEVVRFSGGRTVTVQDSVSGATFASGDLVADGVLAGDILLLLDTTQGDTVFTRYRTLQIISVSTTVAYLAGDLDFSSPGGTAVVLWFIYRGATTYPTAISDPTHYPSGSAMYGKVTNSGGLFSDSSAGNQLLEG